MNHQDAKTTKASRKVTALVSLCLIFLLFPLPAFAGTFQDCPTCPPMVELPEMPGGAQRWAMGATEVTFDQWQACVVAHGCRGGQDDHTWGRGNRPVINVTWDDARAYARWLADRTGRAYGLPSDALWDFAARAGGASAFGWGDAVGTNHANCRDCASRWSGVSTAPVASFPPNAFGLYDMNGNVWEWVNDCWDKQCGRRVIRGGAWYYFSPMARSESRQGFDAKLWSYTIGFRVARPVN